MGLALHALRIGRARYLCAVKKIGGWVQSNLGAAIVGGLVVAIVFSVGSRAISDIPLSTLGLVACVAVVVGLIVFSIANRGWRNRTWGWLFGLRLTTRFRRARDRESASIDGYADGTESMVPAVRQLQKQVDLAEAERDSSKQAAEDAIATRDQIVWAPTTAQATQPPLPRPRWRVLRAFGSDADDFDFKLMNAVPRSVAKEVRLESDQDLVILDAGHWEDLSGPTNGSFRGRINDRGRQAGVQFTVTWWDEHGVQDTTTIYLAGQPDNPF